MTIKQLQVLAMPYLSEGTYKPEWAKSKAKNAAKLRSLLPHAKVALTYIGMGAPLPIYVVSEEQPRSDFYFVHDQIGDDPDLIQYGVKVRHYTLTGKLEGKACGQVSVHRNSTHKLSRGLPAYLFKELFYRKYRRILSDSTQSTKGSGFWETRILEALQTNKKVFALEMEGDSEVVEVTPLTKGIEMDRYYTRGENYSGHYYRFLIE
jgi:hypothetical protein